MCTDRTAAHLPTRARGSFGGQLRGWLQVRGLPLALPLAVLSGALFVGLRTATGCQDVAPPAAAAPELAPAPFVRVSEEESGAVMLEIATRRYRKADGTGPTVALVGAVHIADRDFYRAKQEELEGYDLVLFEGVKSTGMGDYPSGLDDQGKANATRDRMRFLLQLAVAARERSGTFPASLVDLAAESGRLKELVSRSGLDAWDAPFSFSVVTADEASSGSGHAVRVRSLGADGQEGGEGAASDITLESEFVPAERRGRRTEPDGGLQGRLAKALGVTFQLDEMDSGRPHWRNSDIGIDELRKLLDQAGPNAGLVLRMLEGNSLQARIVGLLLGLIGASDTLRTVVKVIVIDQLAASEEIMGGAGRMGGASGAMLEAMQKVIIEDRNRIVMEDLRTVLAAEPEKRTIAIFYGAGHMADFDRRLRDEFDLVAVDASWTPAMRADPREAGLSRRQWSDLRARMQATMRSALRSGERATPRSD
jgi:hypothetical protein